MQGQPTGAIDVIASAATSSALIQVVNYHFYEPADGNLRGDGKFRLDLCISGRHRSARGHYRDVWKPQRFEPLGELFVVHPDADIICKSDEAANQSSIVCELDAAPVIELFDVVPEPTDPLLTASLDVRSDKVKTLMRWMGEEVRQPGFASDLMLEMMLGQLRIEMVRHGDLVTDAKLQGGLATWQLNAIDERLREVSTAPTLVELAALCRLSVRQLSRGFRTSRNASLGAYVTQRQLDHAKHLLARDESVAAIAERLGFATSSSFGHAFRRSVGLTPGQYRARLLRN